MTDCLIAFGSNEGEPAENYRRAVEMLAEVAGVTVQAAGEPLVTQPVGGPADQPVFLNAAIRLQTGLSAASLHELLIEIEQKLGRERHTRWGPRKIDLDLLLYGQEEINTEKLIVPHPRMSFRRFVLEPSCQIAGEMVHATSGKTINQLLQLLNERKNVVILVGASGELLGQITSEASLPGWTFVPATTADQFAEVQKLAKLVVVFRSDVLPLDSELRTQALAFAGPMLDLTESDEPVAEVLAAIEGMK